MTDTTINVHALASHPGSYRVSLKPALSDGSTRESEFADHRDAMAYARLLRIEYGFRITGKVDAPHGHVESLAAHRCSRVRRGA